MSSFPLTIEYIRAVLTMNAEKHAAEEARIAEVEARGYRVVDGGQTSVMVPCSDSPSGGAQCRRAS